MSVIAILRAVTIPIPTPIAVVQQVISDIQHDPGFYARNFGVTLAEAGIGYLWGNGLALALAAIVLLLPAVERVAVQLAIISYCIPVVAVGRCIEKIVARLARRELDDDGKY